MKTNFSIKILLVALLFAFAPSAHAGVGNTHSGGSSTIHSGGGGGVVAGLVDPVATVLVLDQTLVGR